MELLHGRGVGAVSLKPSAATDGSIRFTFKVSVRELNAGGADATKERQETTGLVLMCPGQDLV